MCTYVWRAGGWGVREVCCVYVHMEGWGVGGEGGMLCVCTYGGVGVGGYVVYTPFID